MYFTYYHDCKLDCYLCLFPVVYFCSVLIYRTQLWNNDNKYSPQNNNPYFAKGSRVLMSIRCLNPDRILTTLGATASVLLPQSWPPPLLHSNTHKFCPCSFFFTGLAVLLFFSSSTSIYFHANYLGYSSPGPSRCPPPLPPPFPG